MSCSWIPSHLRVIVHQTRDLLNRRNSVSGEVYTQLQIEREKHATDLLPRTDALVWDQTFEIPLMSLDSTLHITVRQRSRITSDDILGYIHIPLNNLTVSTRPIKNWYKLGPRPGKVSTKLRGDLLLTISFVSRWDSYPDMSREGINGKREGKSLQRARSEKGKESPKHEKQKLKERFGGVFRRSFRRKSSQVFEDCNEEFTTFSVHTPDSPPTPRDRRKRLSLRLPKSDGSRDHSSSNTSSSSTESDTPQSPQTINHRSMFNEATELAKSSGVVDLRRANSTVHQEQGGHTALWGKEEEEEREFTARRQSPIFRAQVYRRRRPLSMYATLPRDQKYHDLSLDSSLDDAGSTPPPTHRDSPIITYRARASFRRGSMYNSSRDSSTEDETTPDLPRGSSNWRQLPSPENNTNGGSITTAPSRSSTNQNHTPKGSADALNQPRGKVNEGTAQLTHQTPTDVSHSTTPQDQPDTSGSTGRTKFRPRILTFGDNNLPQHLTHNQKRPFGSSRKETTVATEELPEVLERQTDSGVAGHSRVTRRDTVPAQLESASLKRRSADIAELLKLQSAQGKHDGLANVRNFNTKLLQLKQQKSGTGISGTDKQTDTHHNQGSVADKQPSERTTRRSVESAPESAPTHQENSLATSKSPSAEHSGSTSSEAEGSQGAMPPLLTPPISATLTESGHRLPYTPSPSPELEQVVEEDREPEERIEEREEEEGKKVKHTVTYKHSQRKQTKGFQPVSLFPPSMASRSATLPTRGKLTRSASFGGPLRQNHTPRGHMHIPPRSATPTTATSTVASSEKQPQELPMPKSATERSSVSLSKIQQQNQQQQKQKQQQRVSQRQQPQVQQQQKSVPPKITYDTSSLPRRGSKQGGGGGGGGIKRALTFYQENKRQVQMERQRKLQERENVPPALSAGNSPRLLRKSAVGQKSSLIEQDMTSPRSSTPETMSPSATTGRHSPSLQSIQQQKEAPCHTSPSVQLGRERDEGKGAAEVAVLAATGGGESMLMARIPHASSRHETESEGIGSSVTSEDTITEDTLQEWSKEELIHEVLKLRQMLTDKDGDLEQTKDYLDKLLLRVMEKSPSILESA